MRRPWNLSVDQHPSLVVMAESAEDVQATVRLAREHDLPLAVQSSGHGAVRGCDGIVINTTRMNGVSVDPARGGRPHPGRCAVARDSSGRRPARSRRAVRNGADRRRRWIHAGRRPRADAALLTVPSVPIIPEPLRGRQIVTVQATVVGTGTTQVAELRSTLGEPVMDTFASTSYLQAALSGTEPEEPMPSAGRSSLLAGLSEATIDRIAGVVGPGSPASPVEIRHLGGVAAGAPEQPSAVPGRDAPYVLAMHAVPDSAEAAVAADRYLRQVLDDIRPELLPGMFVNFMSPGSTEDDVRAAFTPQTYQRLQQVKQAYDPGNMFRFTHNILPAG